jgi:hypothetical protein
MGPSDWHLHEYNINFWFNFVWLKFYTYILEHFFGLSKHCWQNILHHDKILSVCINSIIHILYIVDPSISTFELSTCAFHLCIPLLEWCHHTQSTYQARRLPCQFLFFAHKHEHDLQAFLQQDYNFLWSKKKGIILQTEQLLK